jgi:hypothetical protein
MTGIFWIKIPGYGTSSTCVRSMMPFAKLRKVRYVETGIEL